MGVGSYLRILNLSIQMALSQEKIREHLKNPDKGGTINTATRYQNRLRFLSEAHMEAYALSRPLTEFLGFVEGLIPKDKFNIFKILFRFPHPVVEFCQSIYSSLEKVFEGGNASVNYQFLNPFFRDDWEWYRQEKLHEPQIWRVEGWNKVKTSINSFIVVDLPSVQTSRYPEPYFYWLDIENVIDYSYTQKMGVWSMDWIIFKQGEDIMVIDDYSYRKFSVKKEMGEVFITPILDNPHSLGFCPVDFFWDDALTSLTPEIKKSPLSTQMANLEWLLFFSESKRHLDLYAPYPIYSAYEAECDYRNNATGDYCDGGFLRGESGDFYYNELGGLKKCPKCGDKLIAGAGTFIQVPTPEGTIDMRDPVSITTVDINSLKYNVDEQNRLKEEIRGSVVGSGGDIQERASVTEGQIKANFENRTIVLTNLKHNLEKAMKFVDDTCCKLRYGSSFLSSSISLGTEFYIITVADLYEQYNTAKKSGASEFQLDAISDQIIATENKTNPLMLQRMVILKHLEPYRHNTKEELQALYEKGLLDETNLRVKLNFAPYIDRFERENINIIEFGINLSFDDKIKKIKEQLINYANEEKANKKEGDGNSKEGDSATNREGDGTGN